MGYKTNEKCQRLTSGLASVGVSVRGQLSGNLEVHRPLHPQCPPARTPSRVTLCAICGQRSGTLTTKLEI